MKAVAKALESLVKVGISTVFPLVGSVPVVNEMMLGGAMTVLVAVPW